MINNVIIYIVSMKNAVSTVFYMFFNTPTVFYWLMLEFFIFNYKYIWEGGQKHMFSFQL